MKKIKNYIEKYKVDSIALKVEKLQSDTEKSCVREVNLN
jgi:hypothetical protein